MELAIVISASYFGQVFDTVTWSTNSDFCFLQCYKLYDPFPPSYLFCAPEEEDTLKKMPSNQINLNCLFLIMFVICLGFKQSKAPQRNRADQETSNMNR